MNTVPEISDEEIINSQHDDATIEERYPEIDNKTRKKKKNAENFIINFIPSNDAREEHTITLDTSPLNVPTFIQVTEIALQRLPDVIKVYQPSNVDTSTMEMYDQWRILKQNNKWNQKSEWDQYLALVTSSSFLPASKDPSIFWNNNKDKFPHLANFARLLFGRPTSTGSVERLFSMLGNISCRQRNSVAISNMEIFQIYKEECLKRHALMPPWHKFKRRNYNRKEKKTSSFGSFDPTNYMTEQEVIAGPSGTCGLNSTYNSSNPNAERDVMYVDDDDSS